jgi:PAS domain S-box-containing protein
MDLISFKSHILFNYSNEIILITDTIGRIVEANHKAVAFLGYALNELNQKQISSLVSPKDRKKIGDCLAGLKATKKSCVCYLELHLKSGLKFLVIARGWGIYHQDKLEQVCFFFQPSEW